MGRISVGLNAGPMARLLPLTWGKRMAFGAGLACEYASQRLINRLGDVRGKGLFCGAELVADRASKEPADEKKVQAVVADCMAQGVIIGATNRALPGFNNSLCFSPALIATKDDINHITEAVDQALGRVFAS